MAVADFIGIYAITGHELEPATRIQRHYPDKNADIADAAMNKMVDWYEETARYNK